MKKIILTLFSLYFFQHGFAAEPKSDTAFAKKLLKRELRGRKLQSICLHDWKMMRDILDECRIFKTGAEAAVMVRTLVDLRTQKLLLAQRTAQQKEHQDAVDEKLEDEENRILAGDDKKKRREVAKRKEKKVVFVLRQEG